IIVSGVFGIGYLILLSPPSRFPIGTDLVIQQGSSLSQIAQTLAQAGYIRYPLVFKGLVWIQGGSHDIDSGAYRFSTAENAYTIAHRLIIGDSGIPEVRLTFPEGITVKEMADRIAHEVSLSMAQTFSTEGEQFEGYLFPDTYVVQGGETADDLIQSM